MSEMIRSILVVVVALLIEAACSDPLGASAPAPEEVARQVVADLDAGRAAEVFARFDDTMRAALSAEKLAAVWEGITAQVGALREQGSPRAEPAGPYVAVFVPCRFERAALDAKVVLDGQGRIAGLFFVPASAPAPPAQPEPGPPEGVREVELTVGSGEWALPGTLTLPAGEKRAAGVVLVHGSGPADRDETIGPNHPFRDLAWGLAGSGIAVLRYDKRTLVHAARMASMTDLTVREETVDDALAAVEQLRRRPEIDPARVFLLGHSLGGTLAPRVAAADGRLAGVILLAGATRPVPVMMVQQVRYLAGLDGTISEEEKERIEQLAAQAERVRALRPGEAPEGPILGVPASYWLDLAGYDPVRTAAGLAIPILVLQGERDYQVTMEDLEGWRSGLSERPDVTIRVLPGLNHLFQRGEGPSTPAEYQSAVPVDPEVIHAVAAWILPG